MIIADEYNLRLNRPDTFTYRRQKTINDLSIPSIPKKPFINNNPLDPRKPQDFITPSPLARRVPTDEEMEQQRLQILMKNQELNAEGLANFLKNTIFLAPKIGRDGKPLTDPITGSPIMQNTNLLNLMKTRGGLMSALNLLVDKWKFEGQSSPNIRASIDIVLNKYFEKLKDARRDERMEMYRNLFRFYQFVRNQGDNIGDFTGNFGERPPRGPVVRGMPMPGIRIRDALNNPTTLWEIYNNELSNIVNQNDWVNYMNSLYDRNQDDIIDISELRNPEFWNRFRTAPLPTFTMPRTGEDIFGGVDVQPRDPDLPEDEPSPSPDIEVKEEEKQEQEQEGDFIQFPYDQYRTNPTQFIIDKQGYSAIVKNNKEASRILDPEEKKRSLRMYPNFSDYLRVISSHGNAGKSIKDAVNNKQESKIGTQIGNESKIIKYYGDTRKLEIVNIKSNTLYKPR